MDDQKDPKDSTTQGEDNRLNSFITELIHIQDDRLVSKMDLEKLLEKYQLSQDDINKLQMLIDRHLSRAADFSRRERWDNAIVETERALLFSPLDNDIRLELAELFLKRSTKYGYLQKDLNRADHEVQDALTLEPENREAKKFLKELKDLKKMLQGRQNVRKFIPLIIIVLLILGAALFPQMRKWFKFFSLRDQQVQSTSESEVPQWETKNIEIITSDNLEENFELDFADSTLIRISPSGTPALSIAGYLKPVNDDFDILELELMPGSESSQGIPISLISEDEAPLMQGETESFSSYIYLKDDPETYDSLYVSIKTSRKYFNEDDLQWKKIDFYRDTPLPQGVFAELESRHHGMLEGYDRYYVFYDLRLSNKGMTNLTAFNLICEWIDGEEHKISVKQMPLVENPALPLRSKSVQTTRVMFDLPKVTGIDRGSLQITLKNAEKE